MQKQKIQGLSEATQSGKIRFAFIFVPKGQGNTTETYGLNVPQGQEVARITLGTTVPTVGDDFEFEALKDESGRYTYRVSAQAQKQLGVDTAKASSFGRDNYQLERYLNSLGLTMSQYLSLDIETRIVIGDKAIERSDAKRKEQQALRAEGKAPVRSKLTLVTNTIVKDATDSAPKDSALNLEEKGGE